MPAYLHASTLNEAEIERGAELAFGIDRDQEIKELEIKLEEEMAKTRRLEGWTTRLNRKLHKERENATSLEEKIEELETEKRKLKERIEKCSEVFIDLGKRLVKLEQENADLKSKNGQYKIEMSNSFNKDALDQDHQDHIRELVTRYQGRVKELLAFVDALFKLESRNVLSIVGLQNENRIKMQNIMEQCVNLGYSLEELFHFKDNSEAVHGRIRKSGFHVGNGTAHESMSYNSHHYDDMDAGDLESSFGRKCVMTKDQDAQCDILPTELGGIPLTRVYRELQKSEAARRDLQNSETHLRSQLDHLQSDLQHADARINELEKVNHTLSSHNIAVIEMENKALMERLSIADLALRKLHQEHAKLVAQLKNMQTVQMQENEGAKLNGAFNECARPSDSTSPDLGIDSGHDGTANSDDSQTTNYKSENRELRKINRELALKLKQTRQALQQTLDRLNSTAKQKEEVEKAICRQLHKTHTILRQAKRSVEKFTANQENVPILPVASTSVINHTHRSHHIDGSPPTPLLTSTPYQ